MRVDNAYYKGEFTEYCGAQGWDYSVSVMNENCKLSVVKAACDMDDSQWEWFNEEDRRCIRITVRKAGSVRLRLCGDSAIEGRSPAVAMFGIHGDSGVDHRLPISEAVSRHCGKQSRENASKGSLIDLDLHHPPCNSFAANLAYYLCGLLAQGLLRGLQYWLLPHDEWRCSLRTIIKRAVELPVMLTCSSRRHRLSFGKNLRNK